MIDWGVHYLDIVMCLNDPKPKLSAVRHIPSLEST